MGLDMYLQKEVFIGANYKHRGITGVIEIKQDDKPIAINFSRVSSITEEVGYWRKANQIHKWFVDNVQGGKDECQRSYVEPEQLLKLLSLCEQVLADKTKAKDLLPNSEGFFFGAQEYTDYYFADLQDTIKIIKELKLEESDMNGEYYYRASW